MTESIRNFRIECARMKKKYKENTIIFMRYGCVRLQTRYPTSANVNNNNNNLWSILGSLLVSHFIFYIYLFSRCAAPVFHLYWDDHIHRKCVGIFYFLFVLSFVCLFTESSWLPHRISHATECGLRLVFSYRTKTTCSIRHLVLSMANVLCSGWNLLRSNGPANGFNLQANEYLFRSHTIAPRRRVARAD